MLFKCFSCKKLRLKSKDTYEVVIRGVDNGLPYALTKKICSKCGDSINQVYDAGKQEQSDE